VYCGLPYMVTKYADDFPHTSLTMLIFGIESVEMMMASVSIVSIIRLRSVPILRIAGQNSWNDVTADRAASGPSSTIMWIRLRSPRRSPSWREVDASRGAGRCRSVQASGLADSCRDSLERKSHGKLCTGSRRAAGYQLAVVAVVDDVLADGQS
jgi:hypothetical protein